MSPNLRPVTRQVKSRPMEMAMSSRPSGDPSPLPATCPVQIPFLPDGIPSVPVSNVHDNAKFALFQQLVLSTEKSNTMKKHLNAYRQRRRIDPDVSETVSDDDADDPIPDISDFLGLPSTDVPGGTSIPRVAVPGPDHPPTVAATQSRPQTPLPSLPVLAHLVPNTLPPQGTTAPNWASVLAGTGHAPIPSHAPHDSAFAHPKPAVNWVALSPAFLDADAKLNDHELVPTGIPDALHMMMHLKLFIPLSMLTTASLSHIRFNENLRFKKIPFGNAVGKYALDESHFPLEDSLTDAEYLQAHKHWLSLMKISSEPAVYGSWKAHHDRMCDDPDMLKWSQVWWSHDKQLCSTFMDHPFIIDPDSITYCHQFEHARLDSWTNLPSLHSP